MPEAPEVKKYSQFLLKHMKNKKIKKITIINGRYKKHGPFQGYDLLQKSLPLKVIDIQTKGKFMYFVFENEFYLFVTLGLSGGWVLKKENHFTFPLSSDYIGNFDIERYKKNALNHLNVEFTFDNQQTIYFYDMLSFGTLKATSSKEELEKKLKSLPYDIMSNETTFILFDKQIRKKENKPIGNVLVNQRLVSGIGNYLRCELLWMSKISPFRLVKDITKKEMKTIYENTKVLVLEKGTSKRKIPRNFNRNFFVYKQDTDIHKNPVIKELLYEGKYKRYIYWVPKVQK